MTQFNIGNGSLWNGDCLELMRRVPDNSVDMILCDLPYGTTYCSWDAIIPFEPLWSHYWRIAKPNAAIVLTASQPFATALISSQIERFKYDWIWNKNLPSGFANANKMPMRSHESVLIFYRASPTYNKQPTASKIKDRKLGGSNGNRATSKKENRTYLIENNTDEIVLTENVSPRSVLDIDCVPRATGTIHRTQKPVALFDYLIKTYTNPGDLVLDNCSGSGTTAVAAQASGRRWLCIEKDASFYFASCGRVHAAVHA